MAGIFCERTIVLFGIDDERKAHVGLPESTAEIGVWDAERKVLVIEQVVRILDTNEQITTNLAGANLRVEACGPNEEPSVATTIEIAAPSEEEARTKRPDVGELQVRQTNNVVAIEQIGGTSEPIIEFDSKVSQGQISFGQGSRLQNVTISRITGGSISISGGGASGQYEVTVDGKKITPESLRNDVRLTKREVIVRLRPEDRKQFRFHNSKGDTEIAGVRADCDIALETGNITATSVDGSMVARVDSGNLLIDALGGNLSALMGSGTVNIRRIDGDVVAKSRSGDVTATKVNGKAKLSSQRGNITATRVEGGVEASTSSGGVTVYQCKGSISLRSEMGNIEVDNVRGTVVADTSSGSIEVLDTTLVGTTNRLITRLGSIKVALLNTNVSVNTSTRMGRIKVKGLTETSRSGRMGETVTAYKGNPLAADHAQVTASTSSGSVRFSA